MAFSRVLALAALILPVSAQAPPGWAGLGFFRAPERARFGMVASPDEVASRAGIEILRQGGNAVDAAVAVAFALAVTFPEAGNIAGGGFALVHMADGRSTAVDYREQAPAAARPGMLANGREKWFGYRALGVPGTMAGMGWMHERYGVLPWATVLEPARRLAAGGCPISARTAATLAAVAPDLREYPDVARIFMPHGRLPEQGDVLRQPELAATIETLEKRGWREFYEGELARRIVADIGEHGGIVTSEDWRSYRPGILEPARGKYRSYAIETMPPSTWGGIGLLEMLNILERFPLAPDSQGSAASWHLLIEAMRRAYFDRDRYYRKPGLEPAEPAVLTSKPYAMQAALRIRPDRATASAELGVLPAEPARTPEQTTAFTIVDGKGNFVQNGYTLQGALGAMVAPKGTGVLLSGGISYFDPGCECANEIGPGKRAIYSMTPTLVMDKQGRPWFALGSPGDLTIPAQLVQVIVNLIDFRMPLREAIDAPRVFQRYLPDRVLAEPGAFSPDTAERLRSLGHEIQLRTRPLGDVHAVLIEPASGWRLGWSDGRAGGRAAGY